ncbi:MAG TPA: hypothetical protein DDX75_13270 [Phycisphaerales bacterium]|nr:hypothetical protein [Phycisphaerales bacterium]
MTGRNNFLVLGNDAALGGETIAAPLTADGLGVSGQPGDKALDFTGGNYCAIAPNQWANNPKDFELEFNFKSFDVTASQTLVHVAGVFELRQEYSAASGTRIRFYVWPTGQSGKGVSSNWGVQAETWHHLKVSVENDGYLAKIYLDGALGTAYTLTAQLSDWNTNGASHMTLGATWNNGARWFDGYIDEVKLVPEPATIMLLGFGFAIVRQKKSKYAP